MYETLLFSNFFVRYDVCQDQIQNHRQLHQTWTETARLIGVSRATLYRRRCQFGMSTARGSCYSDITDAELDDILREIFRVSPNAGEYHMNKH